MVRLQRQKSLNRTVVRTIPKKAVRKRGSACAATVSCSTGSPLKEGSKPSFLGAYRTTSFTKGSEAVREHG